MGNKEEFHDLYVETMNEFKKNIAYLESVNEEIKKHANLLKALDEIPDCDNDTRAILNRLLFTIRL